MSCVVFMLTLGRSDNAIDNAWSDSYPEADDEFRFKHAQAFQDEDAEFDEEFLGATLGSWCTPTDPLNI
jgi:hypothetical protein